MWEVYLQAIALLTSYRVTPKKIVRQLEAMVPSAPPLEFVAPELVRGAVAQLRFRTYKNLNEYLTDVSGVVGAAKESGANLLVLPEHVGLLAAGMIPSLARILSWIGGSAPDVPTLRRALEYFHYFLSETYLHTYSTLARLYSIYIAAGSCPFLENGVLHNRACLFGPDGDMVLAQEKLCPLGLEHHLNVAPCDTVETADTKIGKMAVLLGTDAYYPEAAQILKAQGVRIIAAPTALLGDLVEPLLYARAQESGAYVLKAGWSQVDMSAKIIAPAFLGLTEDGTLTETAGEHTQTACVRLNIARLGVPLSPTLDNPAFLAGDYMESYQNLRPKEA